MDHTDYSLPGRDQELEGPATLVRMFRKFIIDPQIHSALLVISVVAVCIHVLIDVYSLITTVNTKSSVKSITYSFLCSQSLV